MAERSYRICGVAYIGTREFPCVLEDQHDGYCDFGSEYLAMARSRLRHAVSAATNVKEESMPATQAPYLNAGVLYRSKTGDYTCPATIVAVQDSLHRPNVEAGHIADLSSPTHVHLVVMTPGKPGHVSDSTRESHPELASDDRPNKPAGGTYQEIDIPEWIPTEVDHYKWSDGDYSVQEPGTWAWPFRK